MAKLAMSNFEQLLKSAKDSTIQYAASSPFVSRGKSHALAVKAGLDKIKTGLSFEMVSQDNFDIKAVQDPSSRRPKIVDDLSLDENPASEKNIVVVVNWLIDFVKQIMVKVNEHSKLIKFTQNVTDSKADQTEFEKLTKKHEDLEKECDEVRQRGMKGNIILSSPNIYGKVSLLHPRTIKDSKTGAERYEYEHEMCARLIKLKTGVDIPLHDIDACHALNKRGSDSTFIIRISNRKPGSAWYTLAAGLLTGRNNVTKSNFTQDNVYLNFQLTKKRSDLSKVVRKAKVDKKIVKYGVDQNGRFTIKVKANSKWEEISFTQDLEKAISNSFLG